MANFLDPQGLDYMAEKRKKQAESSESASDDSVNQTEIQSPFPYGLPRPPGAVSDFQKKCTQCGDCIIACPYGALFHTSTGPVLDPNLEACRLCEDYPCIESCDDGALLPLKKNTLPGFGVAVIDENACLNGPGKKQCKLCVDSCPVDGLTNLKGKMPDVEFCVGCGICISECPTGAIVVVDREVSGS
jgi:ferredoxin-type protein NapG